MWLDFFFAIGFILPGLWVIKLARIRTRSHIELACFSYILSLAIMFGLLYVGGITNTFEVTSLAFLAIVIVSLVHLSLKVVEQAWRGRHSFRNSLRRILSGIPSDRIILLVVVGALLCVYLVFLSSKAILDSDVVHEYLPIAREIIRQNGFTYTNGYDYSVFLKPIGGSVLYAWTYAISGSMFSENFRLMPLIPISLLIFLNYAIATAATRSKTIGVISTALLLVFPFNDRFLLYTSFYPDVFYYPMIFAAIYLTIENFRCRRNSDLFWAGLALGIASLLKAQALYFLIAFTLVFAILQLRNSKKLAVALCIFTPFYIMIPSILAASIQREGFRLLIPNLSPTQLGLLLLLSVLSGLSYLSVAKHFSQMSDEGSKIIRLAKGIFLLFVPFAAFSSLWYLSNQIRFGTLISTSSINLPNYDWALVTLKLGTPLAPIADFWHYFVYFTFMPVDPAVMGYVMLVPLVIGLIFVLRSYYTNFRILLFFGIISASVILSTVAVSLPSSLGYNPRDILPFAPILATLCAIGIFHAASNLRLNNTNNDKGAFVPLLLVVWFGLLAYVHSVCLYFTESTMTGISGLMSALASSVGLNLMQTSFQLSYSDRPVFVGNNIAKITALSVVAAIPFIVLAIRKQKNLSVTNCSRKTLFHHLSSQQTFRLKNVFLICSMLLIIIVPRLEILGIQGGLQGIKENQLRREYGDLYVLFADSNRQLNGGILTYQAPSCLPYYLAGTTIVDLSVPANLAHLRDSFSSSDPKVTRAELNQYGIRYILADPSIKQIDTALNSSISNIIGDPELAMLAGVFGSWTLYDIGPHNLEKTAIPLSGWSIYPQYTDANYVLNSNETDLFLELRPNITESRATIVNFDMPKLNLSDYDYIFARVDGSPNSKAFIRFWSGDGTGFDILYWGNPYIANSIVFDLHPYAGKMLRGEAYIGLKNVDGEPSSIRITGILFVKILS